MIGDVLHLVTAMAIAHSSGDDIMMMMLHLATNFEHMGAPPLQYCMLSEGVNL
jgi:hypothetical protein